MNNETENFLKEGIKRYKQASEIYFTFRKELQNKLQLILKTRKNWGLLKPNISSVKSTYFAPDYPLLNSRIVCELNSKTLTIVIAVNWYQSENDFPFFVLWIEKDTDFITKQEQFNLNSNFEFKENGLRLNINPENYEIEKDFNSIIDEFLRFIKETN
jgi:hypothetical protein